MDEHNSRFHAIMERAFPDNVKVSMQGLTDSMTSDQKRWAIELLFNFVVGVAFVAMCIGFVLGLFFAWLVTRPVGG